MLNSEDLATLEQLAEIEAARAESLRQTVRQEEDYVAVRIGRDGFEEVARREERVVESMDAAKRRQDDEDEWAPRTPQTPHDPETGRRASLVTVESPKAVIESPKSPVHRRRSSVSIHPHSPITAHRPSIEFASAWGSGAKASNDDLVADQDQDVIDLSDIAGDVNYDDGLDGAVESDPMGEFLARPVLWSGGITNPAEESPHTPPIQLRVAAGRATHPDGYFKHLLPTPNIAIAGRVPSSNSLQYLSDRRFDRTKELVTVVLSLDPSATAEQKTAWNDIVEFHVKRE